MFAGLVQDSCEYHIWFRSYGNISLLIGHLIKFLFRFWPYALGLGRAVNGKFGVVVPLQKLWRPSNHCAWVISLKGKKIYNVLRKMFVENSFSEMIFGRRKSIILFIFNNFITNLSEIYFFVLLETLIAYVNRDFDLKEIRSSYLV